MNVIFYPDNREGTSEAVKLTRVSLENVEGELAHQQAEDELADSGDDVASGSFVESTINRRKWRMVIDPEDDD